MRTFLFNLVFVLSISFAVGSVRASELCDSQTVKGIQIKWCVTPNTDSPDILYYFHGGGGDEHSWSKSERYWRDFFDPVFAAAKFKMPTVVVFSFGTRLIKDLPEPEGLILLPYVSNELIPKIEKALGGIKGQRLGFGPSLGGYNGAELSLRNPQLFDRVALLCPGVGVGLLDPFSTPQQIETYLAAEPKSTRPDSVRGLIRWIQEDFTTRENWERHAPLSLAKMTSAIKTKFFVSCSKDDEYGFYTAARLFTERMASRTESRWVSIESGGHCAQTPESGRALAEFLAGLPNR